jgi:hypothetical protein
MRRYVILMMLIALLSGVGCDKGNDDIQALGNPVKIKPVTTTSLTVNIAVPSKLNALESLDEIRAAISEKDPHIITKLTIDGKLFMQKYSPVVDGKASIMFSGLPNQGKVKIDVFFMNCRTEYGTRYYGLGDLSGQGEQTINVYPEGYEGSSDGMWLKLLPHKDGMGVMTFLDNGDPVGIGFDGYATNYLTGEKYFKVSDFRDYTTAEQDGFSPSDIAYYEGQFILGGSNMLYKISSDYKTKTQFVGEDWKHALPNDGDPISTATLKTIGDLQVQNGRLYVHCGLSTLIEIGKTNVSIIGQRYSNSLTVTQSGEAFLLSCITPEQKRTVCRVDSNGQANEQVGKASDDVPRNLIEYKDGYLIAYDDAIYYVTKSGESTQWFDTERDEFNNKHRWRIFKNAQGKIYIISDVYRKVWEVQ